MSAALLERARELVARDEIDPVAISALALAVRNDAENMTASALQDLVRSVNALTKKLEVECASLKHQLKHVAQNRQRARGFSWTRAQRTNQRVSKKA